MIVVFDWNTNSLARGKYTLTANVAQVQGESYLANNALAGGPFELRKACDVNGDGRVDVSDLILVWQNEFIHDSLYDCNNDGRVDVKRHYHDLGARVYLTWEHEGAPNPVGPNEGRLTIKCLAAYAHNVSQK